MESVTATDERSLMIRWKTPYPDANVLLQGASRFGLVPFPRHLLEQTFVGAVPQTIQESQYWGRDFVGAGPFKLDRWEPGSFLEGTAFDQHALGRPKIDRIRFMFIKEQSTALANMLAETTHVALNSIRFEHFLQIKQAWASTGKGTAGLSTVSLTTAEFQQRPEFANPGSDGVYAGPDGKLAFVLQAGANRAELPVLDANGRQAGFDVQQRTLVPSDSRDPQLSSSFPAVNVSPSGSFEVQQTAKYRTSEISSAEKRWRGENQSGWSNPEYDRLVDALSVTLDPNERSQQRAQMAKLLTEDLPALTLTPNPNIFAYLNTVKNVGNSTTFSTGRITWNIEKWELTS